MKMAPILAALALLATPALAQQTISMTDLKIDAATLDGESVRVRAVVMTVGPSVVLTDPKIDFDTSGLTANVDQLPRDQRAYIVENCNLGCEMTVTGVVRNVFGVPMMELTNADTRNSSSAVPAMPKAPAAAPVRAASLPAATGDQYEYTDENGRPLRAEPPPPLVKVVLPPMGAGRSPELKERLAAARRGNPEAFAYYDQHRGPEVKMKCPIVCRSVMD